MVENQGRKRAKQRRKYKRKKDKENSKVFGTFVTDRYGNREVSFK
jgi:hypothetical protein